MEPLLTAPPALPAPDAGVPPVRLRELAEGALEAMLLLEDLEVKGEDEELEVPRPPPAPPVPDASVPPVRLRELAEGPPEDPLGPEDEEPEDVPRDDPETPGVPDLEGEVEGAWPAAAG